MKTDKSPQGDKALIKETQSVWGQAYGRDVSDDVADEITTNIMAFFSIIAEWQKQGAPTEADLEHHREKEKDNGSHSK